MKWLVITEDFPPGFTGGIASWATDVARALHERGHDVTVLCRNTADARGSDALEPYRIVRMLGRSWRRFGGTWAHLHAGRLLAPDVRVLCATWNLATELVGPIEKKGAFLAVAFHGSDLTQQSVAKPGLLDVVNGAHALLPVSRFLERELVRLVPAVAGDPRIQCLPMPLAIPAKPPTGPRHGFLSVSRLTKLKGIDRAIQLAQALGEPLVVVGEGPDRAHHGDGPHVQWLGRKTRDELAPLYASTRAVILTPRTTEDGMGAEGLGLCLLEAAAQGAVPIGCRIGGVAEAVGPGILLDDPDHPDIAQLKSRLDDPALGTACHAWVQDHHGTDRTMHVLETVGI